MATPSPSRWSCNWTKTSATAISDSTIKLSVFPYNSLLFAKRSRFTACSLHESPSSSTPHTAKYLNKPNRLDVSSSDGVGFDNSSEKYDVATPSPSASTSTTTNRIGSKTRKPLTFKSLFGKRFLWRRIFFASRKVRSIILLNVLTLVYASNVPVLKEVEEIMDPAAFSAVRFVLSAIPFIPFVLRARDEVHTRNAGIELGFWVSLGYLMQALGLLTSDAGRASFISMFTVIVVPLLDGMLGAKVPARTWFGALMSITGVGMLESSGSPPCIGDLLNFLSAVFFGVHMLRTEHISRNTTRDSFLALLGYEVCVVALFSTLWYFVGDWSAGIEDYDLSSLTLTMFWNSMVTFPWIPALYTGIFSTGLCLWVEMDAMRDVSAAETAIIYGLEPVWGAGFAWFLLDERWGTIGWIGAALVLGGSLTVQIFGSSDISSNKVESSKRVDYSMLPKKQNNFTTSPVRVSTRKDISNVSEK